MPTKEHISFLLGRLEIIAPDKFMALERLLFDVVTHAEEDRRRRFHRKIAPRILVMVLAWVLSACSSSPAPAPTPPPLPVATTSTLIGLVTSQNGPIGGATIEILDGADRTRTVTTGTDGRYSFPGLTRGTFSVRAVRADYLPHDQRVTLSADQTLDFRVTRAVLRGQNDLTLVPQGAHQWLMQGEIINTGEACATAISGTLRISSTSGVLVQETPWSLPGLMLRPNAIATYSSCCLDMSFTEGGTYRLAFQYESTVCP